MRTDTHHCECLHCGHRFTEAVEVVHNAGKDWEDASYYCPACGNPVESGSEYRMHDGPIPQENR